ncbi:hypothetical protein M569_09864 [Genlisea aurea]|uniref:DYW domain-containing protein n=1 Tax=Genlisea aurea TaxID=192259 RepID=S8CJR2_9LAMI|nr:hypothetical protein M569_09864 [Genlisea aurea]
MASCPMPLAPPPAPAATATASQRYCRTKFSGVISAAVSLSQLKQVHAQILKSPSLNHHFLQLLLSSLSFPSYALSLISYLPHHYSPTFHLTNKIINHLSRSSDNRNAILFFQAMLRKDFPIDRFSFPPMIKTASKARALDEGRMFHALAAKLGYDSDPFVETALMGMYGACGLISDARFLFDAMSHKDIVAWNIMIDGYCQSQLFDDALALLEEMKSGVEPDERIFTTILSGCARFKKLDIGKSVHELISRSGTVLDSQLQTALVNMYANSGAMDLAQTLYDKMKIKNVVASTVMITGHSRHGDIGAARLVFDEMVDKDLVCWSAMISCYAESDHPQEALKIFDQMQQNGIKPDQVTMLSVISACAHLGALHRAKQIHETVVRKEFGRALPINNALIDMYAKCGSLHDASEVFIRMHHKNVISWSSMINAFAVHGDAANALKHFTLMKLENVEPNWITFVGVLYACSHAGLVVEGQKAFESMVEEYRITPKLEHYGCLVDLYGRANHIRKALQIVETMPMAPNVVIWGSLMGACWIHGEFDLGVYAAKQVLELDPSHDGAHIFLSNAYAKERWWESVGGLRGLMRQRGIVKERGCSAIEVGDRIHEFLTGDRRHERADEIYAKLYQVVEKVKQVGYSPNTGGVLIDVDEDEKEAVVIGHSEKLALCYGLIEKGEEGCIRIIKNLRICEDCHKFVKLASGVFKREIVIRDRSRFHRFGGDGSCSCGDFW